MKNILSIMFLFALLASSCSEDEIVKKQSTSSISKLFTASFEGNESRTFIEDGNLLRWTEGDQISLFDGNTLNRQFKFDGETGDNAGTFSVVDKPYGTGNDLKANYAVYPYAKGIKITETGVITATLPAEQSYAVNSFGLGDNTMVAVTEDTDDTFLKFKNVCGYLKLQLYGDNVTVKTITLKGNNHEKLAGKATITPTYGQEPTIRMADDATETITLDCREDGVKIGETAETATALWIVLPPTTFEKGFTITVADVYGRTFTQSTSKKAVIERNVINPMAALEVQLQKQEYEIPYLTFTADVAQSLKMTKAVSTLEYSVNGGAWTELGTNTIIFGGEYGKLQLRGKNLNGTATSNTSYSTIKFGNVAPVTCSGDIRTLLDYENHMTVNTKYARFCSLFYECTSLVEAPELPATTLASFCYNDMFYGCKSLVEAPELPATTLASFCYYFMFYGCTSLVEAPELPATTLAGYCYNHMFYGCTSLVEAPELPATTLANACYSDMFSGCTSLVEAPELSATTLASSCYSDMFSGCTSLVEAPKLPATTLASYCYYKMFYGCTSLVEAPELPATILAGYCYQYMFSGCTSLVEAPELPATTLAESCYSSMFYGCTSLVEAPELPASILAGYCYQYMFSGCTSLVEAPELPATTLAGYCYSSMFYGCTSLVEAPELPATTLADRCYDSMFFGCTSLVEAPELPATTLASNCYTGMFYGCTSLVEAPELPATTLASSCYYYMFFGCTSLVEAPELPATTLASDCYTGMFYGCTSLVEAPELPATTLAEGCYSDMFYGCTSLQKVTMLATDISASYCLNDWLYKVSSTGTFTKASTMTSLPSGSSGIPTDWTIVNKD